MSSNEIVFGGQGQAPDDVRDAIENERRNALSQSISFATTQDPKRIAESMRYGFGPLVPQQSLDAARRAETARKTYDSILNYPVTSSFFQDPAFASIAISDAPNIGLLENTARTLLAAPIGMANAILPMLEFAQGQASGFVDYLRIKIKQNAWEHMTPEQRRQFRQQDLARRGLTEYPSEFRPLGEMVTTQMRRGFQEATEGLQPQTETILGEALTSAGTSIAQFAALLPLGVPGIMAGFGALEFGQGLEEGRKAGLTPDQQLRYAGFNAASEMGFAALPLQRLFASAKGGSGFLRSFWQFSAAEVPAEMATTLTQSFNRWAQIDSKQGQSFESWLSTLKREEAVTFLATLISSAGFSALAHRAEAQIATQAREQSLAKSRANGLTQMADQFVDLSISEEAPDLARQLVNGIAQESGSVDRLRVDTSRLAEIIDQIGVNRIREVLPGVVEEIQQAGTEPGIEAEISPGDYFVAIKQLPELRAALEPHLRVGDSEYSSSEVEQAQAETQQFLADIEQTFNDLVTEARQRESDRSTIYRDVITQVLGADAANVLAAQEPVAAQELEAELQPVEQPEVDPVAVEAITEAIPPEVSQVVQAMTEQMEEAAPEPAAEVEQAAPEPAQEQAPQPTEQQDFLSWFGTSQARTMAGVPMRLVETSPGIYTQSAEGPSGVAVSIRAPLKLTGGRAKQFLTSEKARKSILAQARRSGNDGVIAYAKTKDESGRSVPNTVYAPLDADQVRAMPQSMDILFAPPTKRGDEYSSWAEEMAAIQRRASGEQPKGALSKVADSAKEWLAGIRKKFAGGVFSDAFTRAERTGDVETGRKLAEAAAMQAGKFVFPANHGLREGILRGAEFDVSLLGKNTGAASAAEGVFTSKGFHTALRYAVPPAKKSAIPISNERVNVELYKALDNLIYEKEDQYGHKMVVGHGHFVRANMSTPAAPMPDIITEYSTEYKKRRRLGPTYEPLITRAMSPVQVAEKLETARSQLVLSASRANPKNASLIREVAKKIQVIINQVNADYDLQPSEISATGYRGVLQLYVIFDNPYIFDQKGELGRATTYYEIIKQAKADGHDGVIIKNTFDGSSVDDVYVAFSPTQMKSAEPFTYDKNGKLIPLQKRFDLSTPSVLYGPEAPGPRVTPEQIATQAKLFSMMFSRLAQIMGVRSTDLWNRYGANILAGQLDGLTEQEQAAAIQRPGAYLPKKMTVILNQDQTASTLIHELTHHWMHVFETIASDVSNEQADAIRDEFQVLLDWFGVKDINAWQALPASEKAKHHETLAYNFEDYLATGKAPTNALRSVFRKIKDWFAALYTDLRGHLNESYRNQFGEDLPALTDDVRMLFDRMLGSEVAIARAKQTELAIPLFATQEESGLDDDQWAELQEAQRARDEEAIDKFRAQSVRDLKWSRNAQSRAIRKIQREASKRRKEIRSEVEAELRALPVYRAIDFLRKGQLRNEEGDTVEHEGSHRLSIESVKAEFDQDTVDALGYGRNGMLGKDGLHPDLVASVIGGFQDGTDLVRQVAAAKPLKEAVSERAEVVMRERHAELVDPKLIEAAAADSIRNQHHIRFISKTLRFVSRATQPESIMALAAKYAAQKTLERMTIRDIRPDRFSQAERRTGKEANKAWKSGDEALTTNLLRRQLGQAQLANESRVVRADIDKQIKFLRRLARADKRKAVGADYADYIDMVLSKVVVDRVQLAALPERTEPKTLADYASTVQAQGVPTAATPEFLAELNSRPATDYRDMSYEQLLEIVDLVKEIEQRGKIEHQGKLEFLQQSRQEVEGFLTGAVLANAPETKGEPSVTEQSQRFQANRAFYKYGIQQTTMATKAWFMDGGDYGPWFNYMVNTSSKLMDQEIARRAELTKKLEAILMPLFGSPLHGPGPLRDRLNRRMNIQEMFILACNLGNEGNIQRLEEGNGFDINDVMAEVSESLTADQLRAVQDVWDLFTSLKPEVARLERDTRNSEPIWVEPRPITLRSSDGQSVHLRGGYFPIVYDPIASTESMSLKDKEALESEVRQANAASATRQAYTKQRANRVVNRPLLFSMSNIYGSLEEIVHDLTWRKWSLDMNRILSDRSQLSKTILKKYGEIWLRDINDWRNRLIVDDVRAKNDFGGKIVAYTARYASSASLLYNIGSILIQPVGALAIRAATGGRAARAGLAKYLSNPLAAHREAREKSPALELRYLTRMREFADLETRIQGKSGARRTMEAFGWQLMAKTQGIADTIAWHSGYAMAIEKGHSEAKAVDIAYQVVLDTQSSGRTADLSSIETGAPWKRMFAVFYRVMNTQLNLAMRSAKDRNKATASKIVDMAAIFLVMPYVTYLLKDLITPDEEDDPEFWTVEKQAGIIANEAFQSALGSFWFIRDLGSLGNLFEGETPYAYRGPTGLRLIPDFAKLVEQISQGEMDKTLLKSFSTFLGDITGAPAAAINRMIDGFSAMMEGKDVPAYSILTGTQR